MEPVRHIVYTSTPSAALGPIELDRILEGARAWNEAHDITGSLFVIHAESTDVTGFLQWIEGPSAAIAACFARIAADTRHTDLRVLADGPVDERAYSSWSMERQWTTRAQLAEAYERFGIPTP